MLYNPLAPLGQTTPSASDNVSAEMERDLRAFGAIVIQQVGLISQLPQPVVCTAQVLFQRFWFVSSFKNYGTLDTALGALFLSSKLEESPISARVLINSHHYLMSYISHVGSLSSSARIPTLDEFRYTPLTKNDMEFYDLKDIMVISEMHILKRLGFQTQVTSPYGIFTNYLQALSLLDDQQVIELSWGTMNDLMQTSAPALYPPTTLAVASIYLSTRLSNPPVALPLEPEPWWEHFDASETDIIAICAELLTLYRDWGELKGNSVWTKKLPLSKKAMRDLLK